MPFWSGLQTQRRRPRSDRQSGTPPNDPQDLPGDPPVALPSFDPSQYRARTPMATKKNLPEGTVTFLFSDIEGSTRLLKLLGRERYGEVLRRHNEVLREAFAAEGGIEIDRQGDAFFFVFRSAGT